MGIYRTAAPSGVLRTVLAYATCSVLHVAVAAADPLPAQLQQQIRSTTFEVVVPKPEHDPLTYERPLPLELLPFTERNDHYWSIGTAIAIAPGKFVTAGHVITAGTGGQFATPAIRDSAGNVYPIDEILKFSLHEDFAEFSVKNPPQVVPLATNTQVAIDQPVFAVGDALGDGVVIRDGTLTSMTPEQQDGRWKWLRFSAAASPGNSGGPLIDAQGNIIGIVIGKSPNENLNYALPIERVLSDDGHRAAFEVRESFTLPILHDATVASFKSDFALPQSFSQFAQQLQALSLEYYKRAENQLLTEQADSIFPKGDSARLLAKLNTEYTPCLITQTDDRSWDVRPGTTINTTTLPNGDEISSANDRTLTFFRIARAAGTTPPGSYTDSKQFMDLLLKTLKLPRAVGPQQIRITSLGPAQRDTVLHDHFGRVWQLRAWPLGYADFYVVSLALPTPDGYTGIVQLVPSLTLGPATEQLKTIADYFFVSYRGTTTQWAEFMQRRPLRPQAFDHLKLDFTPGKDFRYESSRLRAIVPAEILHINERSVLDLNMTYLSSHDKAAWDIGGLELDQEPESSNLIQIFGQPRPAAGAGKELLERWEHMTDLDGDFTPEVQHSDNPTKSWFRLVAAPAHAAGAADPQPQILYEVGYATDKTLALPRDLEDARKTLTASVSVTENP